MDIAELYSCRMHEEEGYRDYIQQRQTLFHGTNKTFLEESIKRTGRLEFDAGYLFYLTDSFLTALSKAFIRATEFQSEPTILAINNKLILPRLVFDYDNQLRIAFLNQDEYVSLVCGEDASQFELRVKKTFEEKFGPC